MKTTRTATVTCDSIVGGGQAIGTLSDGKKCFVWGALPGETVTVRVTKSKSSWCEGSVLDVLEPGPRRIEPREPDSYLSTSPWQMMEFESEQFYKSALIEEAFELHDIVLPNPIEVMSDNVQFGYRNKVEFSWFGDTDEQGNETLDLAFFRRGSKGKVVVDGTELAHPEINQLARAIRDLLRTKSVSGRSLKTLLIRSDQHGNCVWQLYLKDKLPDLITADEADALPAEGGELIYSDPRSPASRITERLAGFGNIVLSDRILGVPFRYATEGFFQVNLPVYERALRDMQTWVEPHKPVVDLYSGVGSIGLTIGGDRLTLVELNADAVREMRRNIDELGRQDSANAVLAASEHALNFIQSEHCIIVDPPRAGLHADVVARLLEVAPERIIYLSCNPVTQARDVAMLGQTYGVRHHMGYNFFPRTPHIEHLVILDKK